jgi:putative aminopeptidase FrvX
MRGFGRRHFGALDRSRTEFVCLESLGSPQLVVIEGEGMLAMQDYPAEMRDRVAAAAERAGVAIRRGLRLGLATDGLIALRAGYRTAAIGSVTRYKFPANYHSPADLPENVVYETVRDAVAVCEALLREG